MSAGMAQHALAPEAGGPATLHRPPVALCPPEPPALAGSESRLTAEAGGPATLHRPPVALCPPEPPALAGSESRLALGDGRMLRQLGARAVS